MKKILIVILLFVGSNLLSQNLDFSFKTKKCFIIENNDTTTIDISKTFRKIDNNLIETSGDEQIVITTPMRFICFHFNGECKQGYIYDVEDQNIFISIYPMRQEIIIQKDSTLFIYK